MSPRKKRAKAKHQPIPRAVEAEQPKYRERLTVIGARELVIRGYWDRYPSSDQRKHPNKYDAIDKAARRGPTAFDLLVRDYNSFTPSERRRLRVRVVYGVAPDTGAVLSAQKIAASHLSLDLHPEREKALVSLQSLLVRSGVVDSPKAWKVNKHAPRAEHGRRAVEAGAVPLGIEWLTVDLEPMKTERKRDKRGRFVKQKRKRKGR